MKNINAYVFTWNNLYPTFFIFMKIFKFEVSFVNALWKMTNTVGMGGIY